MSISSRSGRIRSLLRTTAGRIGLVSLLALVVAVAAYTGAQAASCASGFPLVVPPSCFEGGDGNTAASAGKTDWANHGNVVTFRDDTRDTQFKGGNQENDPGGWDIIPHPGDPAQVVSPNQNDVLAGAVAGELVPETGPTPGDDHVFVYGAFERTPQAGNTTTAFELNQKAPKPAAGTQPALPNRSEGDLFITFDGGPGSVVIRMCVWHGDDKGETTNAAYGWYELPGKTADPTADKLAGAGACTRLDDAAAGNKATGAVNAALLSPGAPLTPDFGSSLGIGSFGEMSVDLTRALDKLASAGTADKCFGFGAMAIHTRSSDSGTASLKDFVAPVAIPKLTNCALELEKKVARDTGGALTFENADTAGAAVGARPGDDLQYRFEVKNPSDFPFPQASVALTELTSAGCDANPAGPTNPDGTAVDGTLNKNETWIWTCTRSGPLPHGALENEAKVTGTVNTKEVASATDKAFANVINPSIDVSKDGPAKAYEGSDVSFTVTADNDGNDPLTNVVVTDAQCDPLLTAANASGDTNDNDVLETTETWSWTCVVKNATGSSLTNTAEVDADDSLGGNVDDSDGHTVTLINPSIDVTKTGPDHAYEGSDVSFTVTADNDGNDPLTNVVVTDAQCDPLLTAANASGDTNDNDVLETTETWSWTCVVKNATGSSLTNTAEVDADDSLGGNVDDSDDHTVNLIAPAIDVVKSGPTTAYSGSDVTFTVTADNTGNDPITSVVVTDPQCDPLATAANAAGDTNDDDILDTTETWSWDCVVKNATGTSVTNTATVAGKDTLNGDVSDDDDHTVNLISPSIDVTKSGPTTAYSGSDVTFTVTADNDGDDPITSVVVTDPQCDPALTAANASGDTNDNDILETTETWTWSCVVKNATGTSLTNTATVAGKDSLDGDVSDDDDHTVALIAPGVDVTKSGPSIAYAGTDVTFTVTAENTGNDPITGVVVTDPQCDPALTAADAGGDTNNDDILDTTETWTWDCVVKNVSGATLTNTATVTGKDTLNNDVSDTDDHTVDLIEPQLEVTKTGPASVQHGATITWTITAENVGDDPVSNVTIEDDPCDPKLSNTPDSGDTDGDGVLGVGETWTWSCKTVAPSSGTSVKNVATVSGTDSLRQPVSDTDDATTQLSAVPVTATPQPSRAVVGSSEFRQKATQNCVTKQFRLDVTGREIAKVTFTVDGKVTKVLGKADAKGLWSFKVNPSLKDTKRHRVNAIVEYLPGAAVKSKTLSYLYQRCTCISRRNFQIRVRTRKADPVVRASVYVNGKRVQVIRGKRLKAPVKLIGLPRGRVTVKIVAERKSGKKVTGVRKYYTCRVKSKKKSIPEL